MVVVLDDGAVVDLEGDPTGKPSWTLNVLDANGDGLPDVVTYDQITAEITTFLSNGDGTFTESPLARPDYATVTDSQQISIPVLANDAASARAKISIVTQPSSGTAVVTGNRTISYRANVTQSDRRPVRLPAHPGRQDQRRPRDHQNRGLIVDQRGPSPRPIDCVTLRTCQMTVKPALIRANLV